MEKYARMKQVYCLRTEHCGGLTLVLDCNQNKMEKLVASMKRLFTDSSVSV